MNREKVINKWKKKIPKQSRRADVGYSFDCLNQTSGAVWKSRWTSWAPVPNKPTVSVDVKQHFNNNNNICLNEFCSGVQRLTTANTKTCLNTCLSLRWFNNLSVTALFFLPVFQILSCAYFSIHLWPKELRPYWGDETGVWRRRVHLYQVSSVCGLLSPVCCCARLNCEAF